MANEASVATTHWAVLIGINYYAKDRCLKGSVRDAETIKHYLEEAEPTLADIVILTATTPTDPNSTCPLEKPDLWPTWANVVRSLKRILTEAKPGNFVYIHYSGHGTRRSDGHLALVLFEDNNLGSSYLIGESLRACLERLVKKGLLVTLVLDCCYSGSVARNSAQQGVDVRAVAYDPIIDAASTQEFNPGSSDSDRPLRNFQMLPNQWLTNPDGYTILSACGPHEIAKEIQIQGERRGALTYFLLLALDASRKGGMELTHRSLYQYLRIRFHASWPQQTPMSYGNQDFTFFGNPGTTSSTTLVHVYRMNDDSLHLSVGKAHGVYKGDEYALYPFTHTGDTINQTSVTARVDIVWGLTSDLVVDPKSMSTARQITTGWKAKPITCLSPQKIVVRLMANVGDKLQWKEAAEQQRRFLHLCVEGEETEPCIFNVILNECKEFEILDGLHQRIISLPTISLSTHGASSMVLDVLQHLAMFKYFEGIENRTPSQSFEDSFSLHPAYDAGLSSSFNVKHGEEWDFVIENVGSRPLYMVVFNLDPLWKASNLILNAREGDFIVILPKKEGNNGKEKIRLKMEVPEALRKRGKSECEDILKVFITNKPTFFPSVVLPEMPLGAGSLYDTAGLDSRVRGGSDQLSRLLSQLTTSFRGQGSRGSTKTGDEEWACRNFVIRTCT